MSNRRLEDDRPGESGDVTAPTITTADRRVLDELVEQQYRRVKQLARRIRWQNPGCSATASSLLNQAYLKLAKNPAGLGGKEPAEVLAILAKAMRQILIDQANRRRSNKRGGGIRSVSIDTNADVLANPRAFEPEDVLMIELAQEELERHYPREAKVLDRKSVV